jgi:hypothetical protein
LVLDIVVVCLIPPNSILGTFYWVLSFFKLQDFDEPPTKKEKKKEERERKKSKVPLCAFFLLSTCGISAL